MRKKQRYEGILNWFQENMPVAQSELDFSSPFQLIVAVVLSAQCTDKRVNMVTPELFRVFPDASAMSKAGFDEIFDLIHSVSYPNNKAKHLMGLSQKIMNDFDGELPRDIDSLMTLPGVGRKTANVVSAVLYNDPVIPVDTHVFRVSHRIGLSDGKTPYAVETELESFIPENIRAISHHWLLLHGRYICTARSPKCTECGISAFCKEFKTR